MKNPMIIQATENIMYTARTMDTSSITDTARIMDIVRIMDTASIMDISMIMDTARTIDKAIPIMMTMITIIIAIVMTIIMITMNIKARSRERVYQRYLKDPRVPRVPGVLVHGDNRSDVLYDFKYVYVEKIRVFVDSQTWKIILSLCLYGHVW